MLLFGCTQYGGYHPNAEPAGQKSTTPPAVPGKEKPMTPAEPLTGAKEQPIKPMTPAENFTGEKEGAPAFNETGAMQKDSNGSISYLDPNVKTITGFCHNVVVPAHYCINNNDTDYKIYDAGGIGTGVGYESVNLLNMDTMTVNCSIQFKITPHDEHYNEGTPYYSENYTVTLEPGQWKNYVQYYNYRTENIANSFMGVKTERICEPYPGN